jgi:hypothetical protein
MPEGRRGRDLLRSKGLMRRAGTVVDATLIAAPSSTKNASGERDLAMKQSQKGNQSLFGMKGHIGVDADSGRSASQGSLPRAGQEHSTTAHAVRAIRPVHGAPRTRRAAGMSASARREIRRCAGKGAARRSDIPRR